jgi:tetratricopeptide (TPR) repeat protein
VDRDLFARSAGPQPVFYLISTCPRCYYSGYLEDFQPGIQLPDDVRNKVRETPKLHPGITITPETDQRMIPAEVRYRLAEQCYRWRGMSAESMAWLCLRASWVARDKGSIIPRTDHLQRVMGFIERWLPPDADDLNQADRELQLATRVAAQLAEGRFTRYQVPYVRFVLAMIWRRHGENVLFESIYPSGQTDTSLPEPLQTKLTDVHASIATERRWQRQALEYFQKALDANEVTPANLGPATYLVAELYRRSGQFNRARRYYDRALADPQIDPHLASWSQQQRDQMLPGPRR